MVRVVRPAQHRGVNNLDNISGRDAVDGPTAKTSDELGPDLACGCWPGTLARLAGVRADQGQPDEILGDGPEAVFAALLFDAALPLLLFLRINASPDQVN